MKHTLEDLLVKYEYPIVIHLDNTSSINISKNPVMHSKTNHILVKYHFLREQVSQNVFKLAYVNTKEKIADIFTKPLTQGYFSYIRHKMGVITLP